MKGLMMHCGAEAITREQLNHIMPVHGAMGARHNPVPYGEFIDQVTHQLDQIGFKIKSEGFGITKEGARMFGLIELETPYSDYAPMLGLRGSYDQTLPRGIALGSGVFVCDNLCFSGDVTVKTKQTTNIRERLPQLLQDAVRRIPDMIEHQDRKFQVYKDREMKPRWGDAAIIELVRRNVVTPSQVGRVVEEWDLPTHDEHAEHGHSLWRFHNAVTEAIKPADAGRAAVLNNMQRTTKLTGFLDEVAGI